MLVFTCEVCLKLYNVTCLDGKAAYMISNKRYVIKDEKQDCAECEKKLREDDSLKREQIRQQTVQL